MSEVFISYARSDRDKVERLKDRLQAIGLSCFFDLADINGGTPFPEIISRNLQDAKAVVCFWSRSYFTRSWCMIECREGLKRGVLLPIKIDEYADSMPPEDLRQLNYHNLSDELYNPLAPRSSQRGEARGRHEQWLRVAAQLGRLVGRDLIQVTTALDAREQLIAHCLRFIDPFTVLEFLRDKVSASTFDSKDVWAVLKREFERGNNVPRSRELEEDSLALNLAYRMQAAGELPPLVARQLSYIEASQSAADSGAPDAENANDRARAELRRLLRESISSAHTIER